MGKSYWHDDIRANFNVSSVEEAAIGSQLVSLGTECKTIATANIVASEEVPDSKGWGNQGQDI